MYTHILLASFGHLLSPAVLAGVLVASLWQGLALLFLVRCTLWALPRLSPAMYSAVWSAVLFFAVALPLSVLFPAFFPQLYQSRFLKLVSAHGEDPRPALLHAGHHVSTALLLVWGIASLWRLMQFFESAAYLRRILREATPVARPAAFADLLQAKRGTLRLCTSERVDRPSVAGYLRPWIVLPSELLAALPEADLRHILLHEREHLRRGDHWIHLLGQLSLVLFPLNPALFWLNRQLATEREMACDDFVLGITGARKAYAACLVRVAGHSLAQRGLSLALGMLGDRRLQRPQLSLRVERILSARQTAMTRMQARVAAGALSASLLCGVVLLAHSPEWVSFAPVSGSAVAYVPRETEVSVFVPVSQQSARGTPAKFRLVEAVAHPVQGSLGASGASRRLCRSSVQTRSGRFRQALSPAKVRDVNRFSRGREVGRSFTGKPFENVQIPKALLTTWHPQRASVIQARKPLEAREPHEIPDIQAVQVVWHLTTVLSADAPRSYAAVPWEGGWLLVQI